MGDAARHPQRERPVIRLEDAEARRLITAQRDEVQAELNARNALELAHQAMRQAAQAKNAVFDAIMKKYQLDPAKKYTLDDETLTLTPQA